MKFSRLSLLVMGFSILSSVADVHARTEICAGQIVYNENGESHLVGRVLNVFGSRAEIMWQYIDGERYHGDPSYRYVDHLSVKTKCFGSLCEGETVYGHNGKPMIGKVNRLFENGVVEVDWELRDGESFFGLGYWHRSGVSKQVQCHRGICEGDQVYGNNGYDLVGFARRIFKNGKVEVSWETLDGSPFNSDFAYWDSVNIRKKNPPCQSTPAQSCQ
jgi:hypothetical protein